WSWSAAARSHLGDQLCGPMQSEIRVWILGCPAVQQTRQMLGHTACGEARIQHAYDDNVPGSRIVLDVLGDKHTTLARSDGRNFTVWAGIDPAIANMDRIVIAFSEQLARRRRKHLVDEKPHPVPVTGPSDRRGGGQVRAHLQRPCRSPRPRRLS